MNGGAGGQTPFVEPQPAREDPSAGRHRLDFRTIFELEAGYVMRTLRRLGVAPADVEDMTHEVFLAVHRQLAAYDHARPLKPWLFGFAFRVASHYRRSARRSDRPALDEPPDLVDPSTSADVLLEREERRTLVLRALDQIELERRAVFVMVELDAVPVSIVAATLGLNVSTAHSRLRLARQEFAKAVARLGARRGAV